MLVDTPLPFVERGFPEKIDMSKVKRLDLDWWMTKDYYRDDTLSHYGLEVPILADLAGSPGKYFDRISKRCWFELGDSHSYLMNSDEHTMFVYELSKMDLPVVTHTEAMKLKACLTSTIKSVREQALRHYHLWEDQNNDLRNRVMYYRRRKS